MAGHWRIVKDYATRANAMLAKKQYKGGKTRITKHAVAGHKGWYVYYLEVWYSK